MKGIYAVIALAATVVALALPVTATAGIVRDSGPAPNPCSVEPRACAPGHADHLVGDVHPVTPQEALAAMRKAGARVEIMDGMTPEQAVGLDPSGPATTNVVESGGGGSGAYGDFRGCWSAPPWVSWGMYPYQQTLGAWVSWCARQYAITYWSASSWESTSLCTTGSNDVFKLWGGKGYAVTDVRVYGNFACGIPKVGGWSTFHYFDFLFDYWGNNWFDYISG
jgi:hypothetical protein